MIDRLRPGHNWHLVSLLALVATLATVGVAIDRGLVLVVAGAPLPVVGIVALAALFPDELSAAWAEHRRYVWFAAGLFGFGALIGALLLAAGIDLTEFFLELLEEELGIDEDDPDAFDVDATFFVLNNTPPFLLSILGAITLGLFTALIMLFNGILVGNIAVSIAGLAGVAFIIVGLVPHGIFELSALFVASGVGFRLVHRFGQRLMGHRDAIVTRAYLRRTAILVLFAWLLLVIAAFVEAYLTHALLEAFFAEPPDP